MPHRGNKNGSIVKVPGSKLVIGPELDIDILQKRYQEVPWLLQVEVEKRVSGRQGAINHKLRPIATSVLWDSAVRSRNMELEHHRGVGEGNL